MGENKKKPSERIRPVEANPESAAVPGEEIQHIPITETLDLHTIHPRDVRDVVAEYVREAARAGFGEIRIIHGKGIGVQRRIVASVLEHHPAVEAFALASGDRGHYGATIVRLWRKV